MKAGLSLWSLSLGTGDWCQQSDLDAVFELCKPAGAVQTILHQLVVILAQVIDLSVQAM